MKRILLIATGGTIASRPTDSGLAPQLLADHHPADDSYLLVILFSEIRLVGLNITEKLTYNLTNAIEMSRTHGSLHHAVGGRITEMTGVGLGINLFHAGRKGNGGTHLLQKPTVSLKRTWILGQVRLVIKLCGIKEDTHHCGIIFLHATLHKRCMSFMQSTHSWHQTHCGTLLRAQLLEFCLQLCNCVNYFHFLIYIQ